MEAKSRFINNGWKLIVFLGVALGFCFVGPGWAADLDERGFEFYALGEIHGQHGWGKRFKGEVEIVQDAETGNRSVLFKKGSCSIVKRIPLTTGDRLIITLDFIPGSRTICGRLHFDQVGVGGVLALRFFGGTLRLLETSRPEVDTGIEFKVLDWNRFKLTLDFERHEYEVFMNGESVGIFRMISPAVTGISQLNFFGGGEGARAVVSRLDNLSIISVPD